MSKKILLLGGGGHCKNVLDSILAARNYSEIGIIEKNRNSGQPVLGVPVIGCDDDLLELKQKGFTHAFVTVGSIGNTGVRVKLFSKLEAIGFEIPNIIDPTAAVSEHITLNYGIYIGKNAVVNVGTSIARGTIINTAAAIEHDCFIGEFAHIASGAVLCGEARIGEHTHIGAKSVVKQQTKIGANTLIGMGSVVIHNVGDNTVAFGNPCKEVKTR